MFKKRVIILFLVMLLVVKIYLNYNKENFFSSPSPCPTPCPSPCPTPCPSPNPSPTPTPSPSPNPSPTPRNPSPSPTKNKTHPPKNNIKGIEILFNCNDCSIDDFSAMEKRDIINNILNRFNKLNIENVEFKAGYFRILIFFDETDIDKKYIDNMVKSIKKDKLKIIIRNFTLESFDVKLLYEHDNDYKLNLRSGCYSNGKNNKNNLNEFMEILKSSGEGKNVILQFKPCGPANIFAPFIEINGHSVKSNNNKNNKK